ncbi:N-acetylglucosamine-6-phosphate deacetylase [Bacillus sp. CGMCC 1.16607]|uniref:N-acetylglucosamine-6-phosphate deacetylase n=1 Tax=Bacillus sp. CGMCC 1.16607 TaxID=3351842 RepID=UPI003634E432
MDSCYSIGVKDAIIEHSFSGPVKIEVHDGKIASIQTISMEAMRNADICFPTGILIPGFIDVHVHGGGGADVMDGQTVSIQEIARYHRQFGTTGLLATTVTASSEKIEQVIDCIRVMDHLIEDGAEILGIHLEGPYVNPQRSGAQNISYMKNPDLKEFKNWMERSAGFIKWITLAPEKNGAREFIKEVSELGVVVSAGHTCCSFNEFNKAVENGLSHATHLFNGMNPLHHREPGVLGFVLTDERVSTEVILDGQHIHPAIFKLVYKAKCEDNILLITDCMRAAGMVDGIYDLGELEVIVQNSIARLNTGSLAGSTLNMWEAVKNGIEFGGLSLAECVRLASTNPAKKLGLGERKGKISQGYDADFAIIGLENTIDATCVRGKWMVHR